MHKHKIDTLNPRINMEPQTMKFNGLLISFFVDRQQRKIRIRTEQMLQYRELNELKRLILESVGGNSSGIMKYGVDFRSLLKPRRESCAVM